MFLSVCIVHVQRRKVIKILSSCTVDIQCEFAKSYLFTTGSQTFPNELQQYGVTESLLQRAFLQSTEEQ